MNVSKAINKAIQLGLGCCGAATLALGATSGVARAATIPSVVSAPVGAGVLSAGGAVSAVAQGHAGIAPTVYTASPSLEGFADGVTNGLTAVGGGLTTTGQRIQTSGLTVNPVAGGRSALQTVQNGTLVQVRVGSLAIGRGSPATLVGVGALTTAAPHGTLATAGVVDANSLLKANLAPQ